VGAAFGCQVVAASQGVPRELAQATGFGQGMSRLLLTKTLHFVFVPSSLVTVRQYEEQLAQARALLDADAWYNAKSMDANMEREEERKPKKAEGCAVALVQDMLEPRTGRNLAGHEEEAGSLHKVQGVQLAVAVEQDGGVRRGGHQGKQEQEQGKGLAQGATGFDQKKELNQGQEQEQRQGLEQRQHSLSLENSTWELQPTEQEHREQEQEQRSKEGTTEVRQGMCYEHSFSFQALWSEEQEQEQDPEPVLQENKQEQQEQQGQQQRYRKKRGASGDGSDSSSCSEQEAQATGVVQRTTRGGSIQATSRPQELAKGRIGCGSMGGNGNRGGRQRRRVPKMRGSDWQGEGKESSCMDPPTEERRADSGSKTDVPGHWDHPESDDGPGSAPGQDRCGRSKQRVGEHKTSQEKDDDEDKEEQGKEEPLELKYLKIFLSKIPGLQGVDLDEIYKKAEDEEETEKEQETNSKKSKSKRLAEARDGLQKKRENHLKKTEEEEEVSEEDKEDPDKMEDFEEAKKAKEGEKDRGAGGDMKNTKKQPMYKILRKIEEKVIRDFVDGTEYTDKGHKVAKSIQKLRAEAVNLEAVSKAAMRNSSGRGRLG